MLLHEWYGYHWHHAQEELTEAREFARQQELILNNAHHSMSQLDEILSAGRARIQGLRARLNSWHHQLAALHTRQEGLGRLLAIAGERSQLLEGQQIELRLEQGRLEEELAIQQERRDAAAAGADQLHSEWQDARSQAEAARSALQARQTERQAAEAALQAARQENSALNDRQVKLQARLGERQNQMERLKHAHTDAAQAAAAAETAHTTAQTAIESAIQVLDQAQAARGDAESTANTSRQQLNALQEELRQAQAQRAAIAAEQAGVRAQAEVLEQAEADLAGYARGAQVLLKAARERRLAAGPQALSAQLEVPAELEAAIGAALGEYMDSVLLDQFSGSDLALDLLAGQSARGVLLPLDALHPILYETTAGGKLGDQDGLVGVASELVGCPAALRPAVDLLLGHTLVSRDRAAARRLLANLPPAARGLVRCVTLSGEVFHASGPIFAGQEGKLTTLSRTRLRKELGARLAQLEKTLTAADEGISQLEMRKNEAQTEAAKREEAAQLARQAEDQCAAVERKARLTLEQAAREAAWQNEQHKRTGAEIDAAAVQIEQTSSELAALAASQEAANERLLERSQNLASLALDDLQAQVSHWNTQAAVAQRAATDAQNRRGERQQSLEAVQARLEAARLRIQETETALGELKVADTAQHQEETQVNAEIAALRLLIDPAEAELQAADAEIESFQTNELSSRQALSQAEAHHAQARITQARRQEGLETWRRRIEDDFGLVAFDYADDVSGPTPLPLDGLVEQLPRVDSLGPEVEDNVRRQRAQLRRMGPVNPEAQAEFHEVRQRFQFMTEQVADLEKAETDVRKIITELDDLMERELRKTFEAVAGEFSGIFKRLFDGGTARLLLTDPEDMAQTGIDIEARLPGKRAQGLSLLSGGERSLTAVSLIFALLKVSPTPFCVLDEVDAMLDEANVSRFREVLRELSIDTQFIIVTHNRNTVQAADALYGVTMGRDSSSQVISLKLDQVDEIVE